MRRRLSLIAAVAAALAPGLALAQGFKVGDHVLIGSVQQTGVVVAVGQPLADGGTYIFVHLDRWGPEMAASHVAYDSKTSNVTVTASGGGAPAATVRNQPVPRSAPPPPTIDASRQTAASPALCQQLIRANYPPSGADETNMVSFLSFSMGGPHPYEAIYANDLRAPAAHGHVVTAWPVHARFTVLSHYQDPLADDELRTYDAQYQCYRSARGGWVVEMTARKPGGETAQYIHKR
jgi:hypothetical protein